APARPGRRLHAGAGDIAAPAQAELVLGETLAGAEGQGLRRGLARIGLELRPAQAQRIFGTRAVDAVEHEGPAFAIGALALVQAQVEGLAPRRRLRPQPLAVEGGGTEHVTPATGAAARRQRNAGIAATTGGRAETEFRSRRAAAAVHPDHAAGGIAVQGGKGPAQYFHRRGAGQVHVRDLCLPVRLAGRDAVDQHAQAADAEAGAGTEAAHRDLG